MTREQLDARAEELNISTRSNWKDETVAEKIAEAEAALAKNEGFAPSAVAGVEPQGAAEGAASDHADTTPEGGTDAAGPVQGAGQSAAPTIPQDDPVTITVTGPKKGRWRAGRHFTPAPLTIPLADLSDDEIAMLTDDPKLVVSGLPQD